jgi:hypothetical protein
LPDGLPVGFAFKSNATSLGGPTLAYFNLRVGKMRQHLAEVAHIKPSAARVAFPEMLGFA